MKKIDLKDNPTQKKVAAILLFAAAIILFVVFLIKAGSTIASQGSDNTTDVESEIPIIGDSEYADESLVAPTSIQYKGENGITYTVGTDMMVNISNTGPAVVLDPKTTKTDFKVGFYFEPEVGNVISNYETVDPLESEDTTFFIGQWTDQYIHPAKYQSDEDYGVAWAVDTRAIETLTESEEDTKIIVRTIDLTNKCFLDAFYITLGLNEDGKLEFTGAQSADISVTNPSFDREWITDMALMYYNDDGWSIGTTISKDGTQKNEYYNPYEPIIAPSRYVVELIEERTYSPYILNRGEQGESKRGIGLGEDQFPVIAVTPCYDIANASNGLITIYLYPAFMSGGMGVQYLGYSDWNDPDCSPSMSLY